MTLAKLAVLGSGAVARAVGPRLREAGYGVACWARRDPERVGVPISLEEVQHFDAAWLLVSDRALAEVSAQLVGCLLYTSPSPRDQRGSRMPSSA